MTEHGKVENIELAYENCVLVIVILYGLVWYIPA